MTDNAELRELIDKARLCGADVKVERDRNYAIIAVTVRDLPGCGPFRMSPISAAERLRELVGNLYAEVEVVGSQGQVTVWRGEEVIDCRTLPSLGAAWIYLRQHHPAADKRARFRNSPVGRLP